MRPLALLTVTLALAACTTPSSDTTWPRPALPAQAATYSGGDGSSPRKAVVIRASEESSGIKAEYAYIGAHYPGYHFIMQSLSAEGGKPLDVMTFKSADGKKHVLYFDISGWFGRW